jgi:hypothetical protein
MAGIPVITELCEEKMKRIIASFAIILLGSIAEAKDLQLFNPDVFGQPTTKEIKPLNDKKTDEIEPFLCKARHKGRKILCINNHLSPSINFRRSKRIVKSILQKI